MWVTPFWERGIRRQQLMLFVGELYRGEKQMEHGSCRMDNNVGGSTTSIQRARLLC